MLVTPPRGGEHATPRNPLSAQTADRRLFVDDVVTALTGTVQPSGDSRDVFEDQMKRATEDFDLRTAEAFARALLEALCQEPIDPRRLEALLILGLAHPTILDRHRISLERESERLAAMLNAQGQHDRARTLLDVIANASVAAESGVAASAPAPAAAAPTAAAPAQTPAEIDHARVESLLRKADDAAARGRTGRAIVLLQEVVALDRNRRDVARMIRDLRWAEQDRRQRRIRRVKLAGVTLVLGALVAGVVWRENDVRHRYASIPTSIDGDLKSMRARLAAIDGFIADQRAWFGMGSALNERTVLQREVSDVEMREAAKQSEAIVEKTLSNDAADASRSRGMLLAQQGKFDEALLDLRRALALAGADWTHRRDVQANVTAIAEWIEKRPVREGTGR